MHLQLLLHVAVLPRDRPVQRGGLVEDRRALERGQLVERVEERD